jgi:anaerobic ribonucleoside-triphosphate reductase
MDRISTISDTTQVRPPAVETTDVCWCGQDMDRVRGRHCPRCGTARAARFGAPLPRLAA